jgi:hypothetical protein
LELRTIGLPGMAGKSEFTIDSFRGEQVISGISVGTIFSLDKNMAWSKRYTIVKNHDPSGK